MSDEDDGSLLMTLEGHTGPVCALTTLPGGNIASGSSDETSQ